MQSFDVRDEAPEPLPKFVPVPARSLTPPPKPPPPHAQHCVPERVQALRVARHGVISEISANHRLQPPRRVRNPRMQALAELLPILLQLGGHPFADRLTQHQEVPRPVILPTKVGEPQKVEVFRLPFPTLRPPFSGITPNSIRRVFSGCNSSPNVRRAPADPPGTYRLLPGAGILTPRRPRTAPRSRRRAPPSAAMPAPTDRANNAGRDWQVAAK